MSSANSLVAMITSSGTASPGPELVFGVFFWYLLVKVVSFLVVPWRMPNTYPRGGVRRGTATQIPRDPDNLPTPLVARNWTRGEHSEEGHFQRTRPANGRSHTTTGRRLPDNVRLGGSRRGWCPGCCCRICPATP